MTTRPAPPPGPTGPHPLVAALARIIDPHRGHEHEQINATPHPATCLTCSDIDNGIEVEYYLVDLDADDLAELAGFGATVVRWLAEWAVSNEWRTSPLMLADNLNGMADEIEGRPDPARVAPRRPDDATARHSPRETT